MKKDLFRHELNHLLVSTYQTIEKAEQKSSTKAALSGYRLRKFT